eukprot:45131-Chlamydomonas_euryale.AAC.1
MHREQTNQQLIPFPSKFTPPSPHRLIHITRHLLLLLLLLPQHGQRAGGDPIHTALSLEPTSAGVCCCCPSTASRLAVIRFTLPCPWRPRQPAPAAAAVAADPARPTGWRSARARRPPMRVGPWFRVAPAARPPPRRSTAESASKSPAAQKSVLGT